MPIPRLVQRAPLHDLPPDLPLDDRGRRALARAGWTVDDVRALRELCGQDCGDVLAAVQADLFPDRTPPTVLAWLRVGGPPLRAALRDPVLSRRQALAMQSWSRTFGELGPYAHAAGLTLAEAVHLLAAGRLAAAALQERAAAREPSAVLSSWADGLLRPTAG